MVGKQYLGFDVGGTKITAVLASETGRIMKKVETKTRKFRGPSELIEQLGAISDGFKGYDNIGVIFPAPVSPDGITLYAPNLFGWKGINLKKKLEEAMGMDVYIENDATAQAISVKVFDRGSKYKNYIYLAIGTGIGGGIFIDDRVYRGSNGYAGELGHMVVLANGPMCGCGRRGCLEALASGPAITRRAMENSREFNRSQFLSSIPLERLTAEDIFSGRKIGDPFCTLLVDETLYYLSVALANYVNIFDPEAIFLGGGLLRNSSTLIRELKESVDRELGNYYRDVPIFSVSDRTVQLAPVAIALYENKK